MLYQMLTGRFPYKVIGNMRDVLDNILQAEPARPSTVRRQINDEVETIVLKCLSKDRDRRYQNAGDVSRDIGHYLRGEPIEAKRDSGWYVLRKTARRYRGAAITVGVFLLALVVFAASMSVLYRQKRDAFAVAQAEADAKQEVIDRVEAWFTAPDPTEGAGKDVTMRTVMPPLRLGTTSQPTRAPRPRSGGSSAGPTSTSGSGKRPSRNSGAHGRQQSKPRGRMAR